MIYLKKWSNLLSKHKPLIADKLASIHKTGGGPPGGELTLLEDKIRSIKGKEVFEGIASGIDISSQVSVDSEQQMPMSPIFSTDDDQPKFKVLTNRKRKYSSHSLSPSDLTQTKHIVLEKKQQKLDCIIKKIELSMDKIEYNLKRMGDIMMETIPEILANQNRLSAALTQPGLEHPLPAVGSYVPHPYVKIFPPHPSMYPPTTDY